MPALFQTNEESVEALIASHFTVPTLAGRLEWLNIPDIEGWQSSVQHPATSLVRWVGSDPATLNAQFERVCGHFNRSHTPFSWLSGPRDQAAGITSILQDAGFKKIGEMAGMVLTLSSDARWNDDSTDTWEVTDQNDPRVPGILSRSFQAPAEVGHFYHDAYTQGPEHQRSRVFAAAPSGEKEPAAIAYLSYVPESNAVLLRAAGTLAGYRGKGLYTCLIKRRLIEAKKAGYKHVFVHAYRRTSAPIFSRLGFKEICSLDLYTSKMT